VTAGDLVEMHLPDLAQMISGQGGCPSHVASSISAARDKAATGAESDKWDIIANCMVQTGMKLIGRARQGVAMAASIANPTRSDMADHFVMVIRRVCELLSFAARPGATAAEWEGVDMVPGQIARGYYRVRHFIPGFVPTGSCIPKEEIGCLAPVIGSMILKLERMLPVMPPAWPDLCDAVWRLPRASDAVLYESMEAEALEHGLAPVDSHDKYRALGDCPMERWREAAQLAPVLRAAAAAVLPVIRSMGAITGDRTAAGPATPAQSAPPPSPDQPITTGWRLVQSDSGTHWVNEKGRTIRHPSGVGIYPARCFEQIQHQLDGFALEVRTEASDGSGAPRVDQIASRVRKLCQHLRVNWTVRGVSETKSIVRGPSSPPPKDANRGRKRR